MPKGWKYTKEKHRKLRAYWRLAREADRGKRALVGLPLYYKVVEVTLPELDHCCAPECRCLMEVRR